MLRHRTFSREMRAFGAPILRRHATGWLLFRKRVFLLLKASPIIICQVSSVFLILEILSLMGHKDVVCSIVLQWRNNPKFWFLFYFMMVWIGWIEFNYSTVLKKKLESLKKKVDMFRCLKLAIILFIILIIFKNDFKLQYKFSTDSNNLQGFPW